MAVKTITITVVAYDALKALKAPKESFSDTVLRLAKRKPLHAFFGTLSKETGERLEKTVLELRRQRNVAHSARMKRIVEELCSQ